MFQQEASGQFGFRTWTTLNLIEIFAQVGDDVYILGGVRAALAKPVAVTDDFALAAGLADPAAAEAEPPAPLFVRAIPGLAAICKNKWYRFLEDVFAELRYFF